MHQADTDRTSQLLPKLLRGTCCSMMRRCPPSFEDLPGLQTVLTCCSHAQQSCHTVHQNQVSKQGQCGPGSMLILPAGVYQHDKAAAPVHAAHVYKRSHWASPLYYLPATKVRELQPSCLLCRSSIACPQVLTTQAGNPCSTMLCSLQHVAYMDDMRNREDEPLLRPRASYMLALQ